MCMLSRSNRRMAGIAAVLGAITLSAGIAPAKDQERAPIPAATDDAAAPKVSPPTPETAREADAAAQRHALVLLILKSSGHPFGFFK
jgi:hypothetical protein